MDLRDIDVQWHLMTGDRAGEAMYNVASCIDNRGSTSARRRQNLRHARLYSNRDLSNVYEYGIADQSYTGGIYLTMNLVQSCTDTICAKITKAEPRGMFLTNRGQWEEQTASKRLTAFVDGIYHANNTYAELRQAQIDACLFGTGVIYTSSDVGGELVRHERVLPDEILVDDSEAINGRRDVRNLFRKKWVHREALLEWYVKELGGSMRDAKAAMIKSSTGFRTGTDSPPPEGARHMVPVFMGWHLPYAKGGDDGRFGIAIPGATLHFGDYALSRFPFTFIDWERGLTGFWGRSLAEGLVPIQLKLNETIEAIDAGQDAVRTKIFVQKGALDFDSWTNAQAELIQTNGPPSQAVHVHAPQALSREIYDERTHWWRHGFEFTGVSALSAFGDKPAGLSSGAALREVMDSDDLRFSPKGKAYEEAGGKDLPDITRMVAGELAAELKRAGKKLTVQVPSKKFLNTVDWSVVAKAANSAICVPMPTSNLPTTPGARKEYALDLFNAGGVDKQQFMALLDLPDTAARMDLVLSSIEIVDRACELMLEEFESQHPEEYADIKTSQAWAMQHYLRAKLDNAPDKGLDLVQRFIDECDDLLKKQPTDTPQPNAEQAAQDAAAQVAPQPMQEAATALVGEAGAPEPQPMPVGDPSAAGIEPMQPPMA